MRTATKLKRLLEDCLLNFILIEMLEIRGPIKFIFKLKGHIKYLLMCPKEILMTCLEKLDLSKYKKIPNQKEVILELK